MKAVTVCFIEVFLTFSEGTTKLALQMLQIVEGYTIVQGMEDSWQGEVSIVVEGVISRE
jgi:hypothetical protein